MRSILPNIILLYLTILQGGVSNETCQAAVITKLIKRVKVTVILIWMKEKIGCAFPRNIFKESRSSSTFVWFSMSRIFFLWFKHPFSALSSVCSRKIIVSTDVPISFSVTQSDASKSENMVHHAVHKDQIFCNANNASLSRDHREEDRKRIKPSLRVSNVNHMRWISAGDDPAKHGKERKTRKSTCRDRKSSSHAAKLPDKDLSDT